MGEGPETVETASGPPNNNIWNPRGGTLGGQPTEKKTGKGAWRSPLPVLISCPLWTGRSPNLVLIPCPRNPVNRGGKEKKNKIHHRKFTKEEKQDLMHIAVCTLLESDGYYKFKGRDADGWPHFDPIKSIPVEGVRAQEEFIKIKVIEYFTNLKDEEE